MGQTSSNDKEEDEQFLVKQWIEGAKSREERLNWLLNMLHNYENIDAADRSWPPFRSGFRTPIEKIVRVEDVYSLLKFKLLKRLTDEDWHVLEPEIMASGQNRLVTCAQVHGSSRLKVVCENSLHRVVPKPDVTVELKPQPESSFWWFSPSSKADDPIDSNTIIVNVELDKNDEICRCFPGALDKAIVFAMRKLAELVQLHGEDSLDHTLKALCLATSEYGAALALIEIRHGLVKVYLTRKTAGFVEWDQSVNKIIHEPWGIRFLRSLLHNGHTVLTNTLPKRTISPVADVSVTLESVLGFGSFANVLRGTTTLFILLNHIDNVSRMYATSGTTQRGDAIAVKLPRIGTEVSADMQLQALQLECEVLRTFANLSVHLPSLYNNSWLCTVDTPFVCMREVGVSLAQYVDGRDFEQRHALARVLHNDLNQALCAALSVGYCHADMKPDNVICSPSTGVFQLIDWGLAVKPGNVTHSYAGGMAFFADALVLAYCSGRYPIVYKPQYDTQAVRNICAAVVAGRMELVEPWRKATWGTGGKKYVNTRAEVVLDILGHRFPSM